KIQGIDKWQIWEQSDRVLKIKKKEQASDISLGPEGSSSGSRRTIGNGQHQHQYQHQHPYGGPKQGGDGRHFASRFGPALPQMQQMPPGMGMGMGMGHGTGSFSGMMGMGGPPMPPRAPPPPPPPPPPPQPVGP
ncbi:unnamed protein product, partial [Ectocarpus sp. 12 AP-2014]